MLAGTGAVRCWGGAPTDRLSTAASLPESPPSGHREHLRLAREGALHFVLDPGAHTLTLFQGPAPLRAWMVGTVEAGPRRLGAWGDIEHDWHTRAWSAPRLDPPVRRVRRVIESDSVPPPDPSDTDAWIPPTPEEAVPTPARFVAHYEGGLGFEVVAMDEGAPPRRLMGAAADLLRLPSLWGDRYRVSLTMEASEAGALYRTYPPDASLVIILTTPTQQDTQP